MVGRKNFADDIEHLIRTKVAANFRQPLVKFVEHTAFARVLRHKVEDQTVLHLAVAVDAADTLLQSNGVPRDVEVDHQPAELKVDAFAGCLRRHHDLAAFLEITFGMDTSACRIAIANLHTAVNLCDRQAPLDQLAVRVDQMPASTIGIARGRLVLWDDAAYFEGARGLVWIRVRSRSTRDGETWRDRAFLSVIVASGKLSVERYATMLEQMSGLAAGLVLDLVSKTIGAIRMSRVSSDSMIRTSAVELRILESIWTIIAASLQQIGEDPEVQLQRKNVIRNCWGSELLDARSVVTLVRNGNDPRDRSANLPFRTQVSRVEESMDTREHRAIRGFIDLLHQRACECRANLVRHIEGIESDRKWRDRPSAVGESLYILEDLPRLQQLRNRLQRTRELIRQLRRAQRMEPFANVRSVLDLRPTPVFSNVDPYRRIRHELLRFIKTGLIIVEEGADERMKSTSRLYEQWVFLQLAAAFRLSGLSCASQSGILHTSRVFRFTLDLDRGARVTFASSDGRAVVLRYEPWVMPRALAVQNHDSVYRGREGESAWSPDILIEFVNGDERTSEAVGVEYAVVIDAKYSRRIRDHHWANTTKYLEIRATANDRQVVRQQWLAFPGDREPSERTIVLRDSTVRWTDDGPNCPRDETLQGSFALAPPPTLNSDAVAHGWIAQPEFAVREFVTGLLRYMDFDVA